MGRNNGPEAEHDGLFIGRDNQSKGRIMSDDKNAREAYSKAWLVDYLIRHDVEPEAAKAHVEANVTKFTHSKGAQPVLIQSGSRLYAAPVKYKTSSQYAEFGRVLLRDAPRGKPLLSMEEVIARKRQSMPGVY